MLMLLSLNKRRWYRTRHTLQWSAGAAPNQAPRFLSAFITTTTSSTDSPLSSPPRVLSLSKARKQALAWSSELSHHDHLYHNLGTPKVSDATYDARRGALQHLLDLYPELRSLITQTVGASPQPSSYNKPYSHTTPMLSLENTFETIGLRRFLSKLVTFAAADVSHFDGDIGHSSINNPANDSVRDPVQVKVVVEPKVDGVSLSLRYENGRLVRAGTRGNGTIGLDVSSKVAAMSPSQAPPQVDAFSSATAFRLAMSAVHPSFTVNCDTVNETDDLFVVEVRGEVYLPREQSEAETDLESRGTPRNRAAGILRQKPVLPEDLTDVSGGGRCRTGCDSKGGDDARHLRFFAYTLLLPSLTSSSAAVGRESEAAVEGFQTAEMLGTQTNSLALLSSSGFKVSDFYRSFAITDNCRGEADLLEHIRCMEACRSDLPYDTDGVVVKAEDLRLQAVMGCRSRSPRWALAYKYANETGETTLLDIDIQVGRTGILTPVAHLNPINIGGVMVSRATLHNEAEVNRLQLVPGARVCVARAGDVIPKILGLVYPSPGRGDLRHTNPPRSQEAKEDTVLFRMPSECPVCGSPVTASTPRLSSAKSSAAAADTNTGSELEAKKIQSQTVSSVMYRCSGGSLCQAQSVERIRHFASKAAMDIRGLGPRAVEQLFDSGHLRGLPDLFRLKEKDKERRRQNDKEDKVTEENVVLLPLRELEGWGDKSVQALFAAVEESRRAVTLQRFLVGLGIPHVGALTAELLAAEFRNDSVTFLSYLHSLRDACGEEGREDERVLSIKGVGGSVLLALKSLACDPARLAEVELLQGQLLWPPVTPENTFEEARKSDVPDNPCRGKAVVFTGRLRHMTRDQAEKLVAAMGGVVKKRVSKAVHILVVAQVEEKEEGASLSAGKGSRRQKRSVTSKQRQFEEISGSSGSVWTEQEWLRVCEDFNKHAPNLS